MSHLNKKVTDLRTFIKDNWKVVKRIMYGNLLMLLSGLREFNIITKEMAVLRWLHILLAMYSYNL